MKANRHMVKLIVGITGMSRTLPTLILALAFALPAGCAATASNNEPQQDWPVTYPGWEEDYRPVSPPIWVYEDDPLDGVFFPRGPRPHYRPHPGPVRRPDLRYQPR